METYTTTKQLLIDTEIPTGTKTYKPVSHTQLMDLTLNHFRGKLEYKYI